VKRGLRFVHGDKELIEKLGRNDPCPCGSELRFQALLPDDRPFSMEGRAQIIGADTHGIARNRAPAGARSNLD